MRVYICIGGPRPCVNFIRGKGSSQIAASSSPCFLYSVAPDVRRSVTKTGACWRGQWRVQLREVFFGEDAVRFCDLSCLFAFLSLRRTGS